MDAGNVGKGVLLNVPLPEFDVVGSGTLVLALGGLKGHGVEWVSQSEVVIDKVKVALGDSMILCHIKVLCLLSLASLMLLFQGTLVLLSADSLRS